MTARPIGIYRDPLVLLLASKRGTCKGCPHQRNFEFIRSVQTICAIGRAHSTRCEQYGLRQKHMEKIAVGSDRTDEVLIEWFEWSEGYRVAAGYKGADTTCRDSRSAILLSKSTTEIGRTCFNARYTLPVPAGMG